MCLLLRTDVAKIPGALCLKVFKLVRHVRGASNACDLAGVQEMDGVIGKSSRDMPNYRWRLSAGHREGVKDNRRRLLHHHVSILLNLGTTHPSISIYNQHAQDRALFSAASHISLCAFLLTKPLRSCFFRES